MNHNAIHIGSMKIGLVFVTGLLTLSNCTAQQGSECLPIPRNRNCQASLDAPYFPSQEILQLAKSPTSLTLGWEKASDDATDQDDLSYRIVYANDAASIDFEAGSDTLPSGVILVQDWTKGSSNVKVPGLTPATSYQFAVFVKDADGQVNYLGPQALETSQATAPSTGTAITFRALGPTGVTLAWGTASDPYATSQSLEYRVVQASSPDLIDTPEEATGELAPGVSLVQDWTPALTELTVTGLTDGQSYYFAVVVRNSLGLYAIYPCEGVQTLDITAPTPGGNFLATQVTNTTARLSWTAASDNSSGVSNLYYKLVTGASAASLDTIAEVETIQGAQELMPFTAQTTGFDLTGLTPGSLYYFNLLVKDEANNRAIYTPLGMWTTDNTPPVPGTGLSFSNITTVSMDVNWGVASDSNPAHTTALLEYKLVRASTSNAIDSLAEVNAITTQGAGLVADWTPNLTNFTATGLLEGQTYVFAVAVRDPSGNYGLYTPASQTTSIRTRFIFRSSSAYDGNLGGIAGADTKCNQDSARPDGNLTYKALLVDGVNRVACTTANCSGGVAEHTNWVLRPNTPYKNLAGVTVGTTDASGIFSSNLSSQINVSSNNVWTGLSSDFTTQVNRCSNWLSNSNGLFGRTGSADQTFIPTLISLGSTSCATTVYLYCVEQ